MKKLIITIIIAIATLVTPSHKAEAATEHFDLLSIFTSQTITTNRYGWENVLIMQEQNGKEARIFARIAYPAGSYDPGSMMRQNLPVGGAGFRQKLSIPPADCAHIVYQVRFAPDFPFVIGGKLPGLGGGQGNTGGDKADGFNGFSSRFMWRMNGAGEIYAYLPNNGAYGTSLGQKKWSFTKGVWQKIEQKIVLNHPGASDGLIAVWLNDQLVHVEQGLRFRDTPNLKVDQVLFETFFGGNSSIWAPSINTFADFSDVAVVTCE